MDEKIQTKQINGTRIVTGLSTLASKDSLYFETRWKPLVNCRLTANDQNSQ